jgi:signal transduction histidine kinase
MTSGATRVDDAILAEPEPDRARVLIIEDNRDMRHFMRRVLGETYAVETAADGREGLAAAVATHPDLVITDVMMPGLSGDALVAELRNHRDLHGMPILVVSAKADDELRVRLLREGAQDYLVKPFALEELRARAANLIATARTRAILRSALESRGEDLAGLAAELAQHKRYLDGALGSMRAARAQAERANQFKSDFLSLISHELRTPLNALNLQIERLRRGRESLSPKQSQLVDRAVRTVLRLGDLIDSLLEYSRIEQDRLVVIPQDVDLGELAGDIVEEMASVAEQKGLALRLAGPSNIVTRTDPRLLRLVLVNLVGNAVKFTDQGSVEVEVADREGPRVRVRDTGRGIAPENQARIFEPFEQLEQIKHKHTTGVGLGLALVRELSRAIGAQIELESELGGGSTFTVVLPSRSEKEN